MHARAQFVLLLFLLGILGLQAFLGIRAEQERNALVELEPPELEPHAPGSEFVLDAALFWLDRGSVDEALLVAGSVPLSGEEDVDLRLSFRAPDAFPAPQVGSLGRSTRRGGSARTSFAQSRFLPPEWDRPEVDLQLSGHYSGPIEGLHALPLNLRYDVSLYGPSGGGRTAGSESGDLLLPTGGVAALRRTNGDLLLLLGVRPAGDPFESNRTATWRARLLESLDVAQPTEAAVAAGLAASPSDGRPRGWNRVDPALELAVAGIALADVELCDRAAAELSGSLAELDARVDRSITVPAGLSENTRRSLESMARAERASTFAAAVACGAVPFRELSKPSEPEEWLRGRESPLRLVAVSSDAALLGAVVDQEVDSRAGNHRIRYAQAALANSTLGRTDTARAEWRRLRAAWLARGGWAVRAMGQGAILGTLWMLLPWLVGLALVVFPARRSRPEPILSRGGVLGLLLLSAVTLDGLRLLLLATPFWWWLGRSWLVSGRRPLFDRALVFLTVGATGAVLGFELGVTGIWGSVETWVAIAQAFGLFLLGRIFVAQQQVWDVPAWTIVLAIGVLAWPAEAAGVPDSFWWLWLLAALAALARFFHRSAGGGGLRAHPA